VIEEEVNDAEEEGEVLLCATAEAVDGCEAAGDGRNGRSSDCSVDRSVSVDAEDAEEDDDDEEEEVVS
jgi:hypothetical protein